MRKPGFVLAAVAVLGASAVRPDTAGGYVCNWDIPFGGLRPLDARPEGFAPQPH